MARIVGNLAPEDDSTHPVGSESNFNESMYFNFFDPARATGGFLRLGNRPNEGRAERTVTLFLPDGRVLFGFRRAPIAHNDAFDAGGLRFEVLEPTERLRTVFDGDVIELAEPRRMADPRQAFRESPKRRVRLDLEHRAVGPLYGQVGAKPESEEEGFARAHYEQHMAVRGEIHLGDEALAIEGFGLRDHSWGPRSWQSIRGYEWLTLNFGADFGAMISVVRKHADSERVGGVVVRGDALDPITRAEIDVDYEDGGLYHRALRARVDTRGGEHLEVEGTVRSFIPLRNRRDGRTTHIGEGMTEWRCGDRTGFGLSELLRQLD